MFAEFEHIYCVNLRRNPERWAQFLRRMQSVGTDVGRIVRFDAVDGRICPPPTWWRAGAGAWGCMQSHLRILEQALAAGVTSVLIFEDDAIPTPDLARQYQAFIQALPANWDCVMLGGQHLRPPRVVNSSVVRVINGNRTHAYGLRGSFIQAVYRHLCDYASHALKPTHHIDHRLGVLHESGQFNIYAPYRWFFSQGAGHSDIQGADLPERSWNFTPRASPAASPWIERIQPLVVLGTYRSGTSCVAGVLDHLGYYLGSHLAGPTKFNRWGFFEPMGLSAKLRLLLNEPSFDEPAPSEYLINLLRAWLHLEGQSLARDGRPIAVKSPLLSLIGPQIRAAWGPGTRFILVQRDPTDTLNSLQRTGWWTASECQRLHAKLSEALTQFAATHPCYAVHYEQLLSDASTQVTQLASWLNPCVDPSRVNAAVRFVHRP